MMNLVNEIEQAVLQREAVIRTTIFCSIFVTMMICERWLPCRQLSLSRWQRWRSNLGLFLINTMALRLLFPAAAVGIALSTRAVGWGGFNQVAWPFWVEVIFGVVLLDLAIYFQHRLMHQWSLLWRLHRVHHADMDFDLTTATRFHTLEIILSMLIKWGVILILGPGVLAVLIFEVLLSGMAIFNHANVDLPAKLDRWLRKLVVTPDMHRVHHSIKINETNSNYGFNLSIWDHWFGSYVDQPESGHQTMTIGIPGYRNPVQVNRLAGMLRLPFIGAKDVQREGGTLGD